MDDENDDDILCSVCESYHIDWPKGAADDVIIIYID